MSFEELRAFLAVAEHQSFAGAATALGIARTSLRRQVDALEAQTGVPLLERGHAGVVLTEAGRQLVERGRGLEREFTAMLGAVRETGAAPSGLLRLLLPVGMPNPVLAGLIALARSAWPGMRLAMRFADAPLASALNDVDLLAWFGLDAPVGAWQCHTFTAAPLRLVATRDYLARAGTPRSLDDLNDHELFVWTPPGAEPSVTTRAGSIHPVRPVMSTTNVDLLHDCAHRGLGVTWLPDGNLPAIGRDPFVPVLPELVGAPLELRVACPVALTTTPRLKVFLSNLEMIRAASTSPDTPR